MKVRNGFVSNSSSSSFICNSCGGDESGWDFCLQEAEMFKCKGGHVLHECCAPNFVKPSEDDENYDEDWRYEGVSEAMCPFCSLEEIDDGVMSRYLLAEKGVTKIALTENLRGKFPTLSELLVHIKKLEDQ